MAGFNQEMEIRRPNIDKTSLDVQRNALNSELERLHRLPAGSSYAQHRLRIAETALAILNKQSHEISTGDLDALEEALKKLGI